MPLSGTDSNAYETQRFGLSVVFGRTEILKRRKIKKEQGEKMVTKVSKRKFLIVLGLIAALCITAALGINRPGRFARAEEPVESGYTTTNVALGKPVSLRKLDWKDTATPNWIMAAGNSGDSKNELGAITDGVIGTNTGCVKVAYNTMAWAVIDLEENYTLTSMGLCFFDNHAFDKIVIQVATDADFTNPITVYNTDTENAVGQGAGKAETFNNKVGAVTVINFSPVYGRYVRVTNQNIQPTWAEAFDMGSGFIEIEVYGVTGGVAPVTANRSLEYQESKFNLELAHENESAKIYYTLDGSYPTTDSTEYTAAIDLTDYDCVMVRAIAAIGGDVTKPVNFRYSFVENPSYPTPGRAPWEKFSTARDVRVGTANNDGVQVNVLFNSTISLYEGTGIPGERGLYVTGLQDMAAYNELILINGTAIKDIEFPAGYGVNIRPFGGEGDYKDVYGLSIVLPRADFTSFSVPENQWGGIAAADALVPYINEIVIKAGLPMWKSDGTENGGSASDEEKLAADTYLYNNQKTFLLGERAAFMKDAGEGSIINADFTAGSNLVRLYFDGGFLFDDAYFLNHIMRHKTGTMFASDSAWAQNVPADRTTINGTALSAGEYAVASGLRYNVGKKILINGLTLEEWYDAPVKAAINAAIEDDKDVAAFVLAFVTSEEGWDFDGMGDTHIQKANGKDMLYIKLPTSGSRTVGTTEVTWTLPDLTKGIEVEILPGFGGASTTAKNIVFSKGAKAVYNVEYGVWLFGTQQEIEDQLESLKRVENVVGLIDALPETITLEDKTAVMAARTAFDALTEEEKASVTNLEALETAEAKIVSLEKVKNVADLIGALPETITLEDKTAVAAARTAFDALTEEEKASVTNLEVLEAAEAKIAALEKEGSGDEDGDKEDDGKESGCGGCNGGSSAAAALFTLMGLAVFCRNRLIH